MIDTVHLQERPALPYVSVHAHIASEADFRRAADTGFPRVFGWLSAHGIAPGGAPFTRFLSFDATGQPTHIEIAAPVSEAVDGDEGIDAGTLPAGRWLVYVHRGPYTHASEPGLQVAHATVRAWAEERGIALGGCTEQYLVGPVDEPDYARWETEIAYLVE